MDNEMLDAAGKPLSADLKSRAVTRGHEMKFYADQIRPRGHNPRMWSLPHNKATVIEFAQSIHDVGVLNPIIVLKEGTDILIDDGETRWLAVKLLEGDDLHGFMTGVSDPNLLRLCGLHPKNDILIRAVTGTKRNDEDRLIDTVIRNTGQRFADLEYAKIIKQLTDWGKGQSEIAAKLGGEAAGWTQTRVSHIYQLNFASPKLQQLLAEEVILTTTVVTAMRDYEDRAEEAVLSAIADIQTAASDEADAAETEARDWKGEVQRIIESGDTDMIEPAPGKRKIPVLENAQRRATKASEKAESARKVATKGPSRVTSRDIATAVARRSPESKVNLSLSKSGVLAFIDGVKFEAQYSIDPATRERMNSLLVKFGLPEMPARVDDAGQPLPLAEEAAA